MFRVSVILRLSLLIFTARRRSGNILDKRLVAGEGRGGMVFVSGFGDNEALLILTARRRRSGTDREGRGAARGTVTADALNLWRSAP